MSAVGRRLPRVGLRVEVVAIGWRVGGAISTVSPDLHELTVITDEGEHLAFRLNPVTARFSATGSQSGARLAFSDDPAG